MIGADGSRGLDDDLVVEHDGEGLADVLGRRPAPKDCWPPRRLKRKLTTGSPDCWSKPAGRRSGPRPGPSRASRRASCRAGCSCRRAVARRRRDWRRRAPRRGGTRAWPSCRAGPSGAGCPEGRAPRRGCGRCPRAGSSGSLVPERIDAAPQHLDRLIDRAVDAVVGDAGIGELQPARGRRHPVALTAVRSWTAPVRARAERGWRGCP